MRDDLSVEELVIDDSFCNYCFESNEADISYWQEYARLYPSQKEKIAEARKMVLALHVMFNETGQRSLHDVYNVRKWAAPVAASLAILLSLAAYFYFSGKNARPSPAGVLSTDVGAPRSGKAVIALANGQKIYLDSVATGNIVMQGNTRLLKQSENIIAYQPTKEQSGNGEEYNTLTNPNGSRVIQMQLSDGSLVWLNVGSTLTYPVTFRRNERKVSITGEAYFEVAHNAIKPFIVCKGNTAIQVLGTHFNVNAYDDESYIKITLLQGAVNVKKDTTTVSLKPGQQADVTKIIQVRNNVDTNAVMAWKNGYFHFNRANLQEVLKQLSRWYDVEVIYSGAIPSREFVGEMERALNLSQVLSILEQNNIHFSIQGKKIIVRP